MYGESSQSNGRMIFMGALVMSMAAAVVALFGSGSRFGGNTGDNLWFEEAPPARLMAQRLVQMDIDADIDETFVNEVVATVKRRAAEGDVAAAAFVVEYFAESQKQRAADSAPVSSDDEGVPDSDSL